MKKFLLYRHHILLIILVILVSHSGIAQTGPGGVGTSSNNAAWLKASSLSYSDGDAVSTWTDISGNSDDWTQGSAGLQPTFETNELNGRAVVRFDGSDALEGGGMNTTPGDHTVILVGNSTTAGFFFDNNETGRFLGSTHASGGYWDKTNTWQGTRISPTSTEEILTWVLDDAGGEIFIDGTSFTTGVFSGASFMGPTQILGSRYDESTQMMNGDFAEFIVYEGALTEVQRIIVENYLAAEYNISIANSKYSYSTTYGYDVVGIGQSSSVTHTESQSANLLRIDNASSLDADDDFMFAGHDNGSIASWTSTDSPDSDDVLRVAREWRFEETGDIGTISLAIDTADLPAKTSDYDFYQIWVDSDGTFSDGATAYPVTLNGDNEYEATGVDISTGDYVTIAIFRPVISFTSASSSGAESATSPSIGLTLNYEGPKDVSVSYSSPGTGTADEGAGNDFTLGATATISAGSTTTNITTTLNNDSDVESDETIVIDISGPTYGILGTIQSHTFTIQDDDNARKIDFNAASSNGGEGTTPVSITVEINSADGSNPTTVDYEVTSGTATGSGTDYTLASGTATIAATFTSTTISLALTDDVIDEDDETVIITLSNPSNANLGTDQTHTFTINDDDDAPTVSLLSSSDFVSEGTSTKNIVIGLSAISGQDVTVDYVITGSATGGGTDYTLADGTATISAGNSTGNIVATIVDDAVEESAETIICTISNPSGASLGSTTVHTLTINDNEVDGMVGPGGVGETSNMALWLRASDIGGSDGDAVSTWADNSGNDFDYTQGTGSKQPTYQTNELNGWPVVRFDGSDVLAGTTQSSDAGDHTIIAVLNSTSTCFYTDNNESGRFLVGTYGSGAYWDITNTWSGTTLGTGSTEEIVSWVLDDAGGEVFVDGTSHTTGVFSGLSAMGTTQTLGSRYDQTTQMMNGDMAEWIVFESALNEAQRIIVENYLGAKYGIAVANDYFSYESTHGYGVGGIGQSNSTKHSGALSDSLVGVASPSALDADGDFLLFGHDNGSIASWVTTDAPNDGVNTYRVDREWRFDLSGSVGSTSLLLNISDLPTAPSGYTQYALFVDADGVFASGADQYELALEDGYYRAHGITISDEDYLTIGMVKPTVEFTASTGNGGEDETANVELTLSYALANDITVDYAVTGGTATGSGTDYTLASGTATILAGQTTTYITPLLVNDTELESDETIEITLSNPSSGTALGTNTAHTYSINDDDNSRKIDFNLSSSSGGEGTSPVSITVDINSVDASNPTTVDYAVTGGTATSGGTDFTLASGTATVAATTTSTTFDIAISDDLLDEADETIIITLSNPSNANLGTDQTHTFTITDDDAAPTVEHLVTTSIVSEGTSSKNIVVTLSAVSGQDVTVDYAITGTATGSGTDYTLLDGTATITAGNSTTNITALIIDDASSESTETIISTLSSPSGASLGTNTVHTMSIYDNENDGFTGPGGVGDADNNAAWLKASTLSLSDGDAVTSWTDISGNSDHWVQGSAGLQPTFETNELNGRAVIRFDGSDALQGSGMNTTPGDHTVILVGNSTTAGFFFDNNETGRFLGSTHASGGYWDKTNTWQGTRISPTSTEEIYSWVLDDAGGEIFIDGSSHTTGVFSSASFMGSTQILGSRYDESTQMMNGDFAEFIVYEGALTAVQRIIVENYLAAEYGISIANDKYSHESTHGYDVAGIGQSGSDTHEAALSASMFGVSNPSSVDTDGDFLLFGHDNGDAASWVTTDAPNSGTNTYRIAREWIFDETADVGSITLMIDTTDLPAKPSGYDEYVVWVDGDGTFATDATQYTLELSSGYYVANNVDISDGDYATIGMIKPTIEFTATTGNSPETTAATIEVSMNTTSGSDVTVDYTVTGGTATGSGTDYTLADGTLTILAGQTTADISPSLINDTEVESDETIIVTLSNPSAGFSLGDNTTHTFSINDDDNSRKVDFQVTSSSGAESVASVSLTVEINSADGSNPTTVDYSVTGGTATGGGDDYTLASGTATITAGNTTESFNISIVDDAIDEATETIIVTLSNPTNCNLNTSDLSYTYSITDNDAAPTVQFTTTSSSGDEGSSPSIAVELSAASGQDVTVDYALTGTATGSGTDYTLADGTHTIEAGYTSQSITIPVVDDASIESPETIILTLSSPSEATLGGNTVHTYTILDNDNDGITGPGGVGGSSNNVLWLKADTYSGSDGDAVSTWSDESGNSNDYTQGTGSKQPTYETNELGGRPVMRFDGSDVLLGSTMSSPAGDHTIIGVLNSSTACFYTDNNESGRFLVGTHGSGAYWDITNTWEGTTLGTGTSEEIVSWVLDDAGGEVFVDGTSHTTGVFSGASAMGTTQTLGSRYDASTQMMTGDMAEWIVYSQALNTAQRIIVENYLAAKYDLTIANDVYDEAQGGTDYDYEVAGIGHAGGSDYHNACQSGGNFTIDNPSSLASGDYLLFGHDNADITTWTTTEQHTTNAERLAREWFFDETNDVGTVSITIDVSGFPALNAGFTNYVLLIDADGDFSAGASSTKLTLSSGTEYYANEVDISDGDYMAIGAIQYITDATGDWDAAASWDGNAIPGTGDGGVITGTHVITLTQDETVGSLDIATGATLAIGSHTLTLDDGCITLGANATITMTTGTIKYAKGGDQCVTGTTTNFPSYANIELSTSGTKTLEGDIVVTGNLDIANSVTLDVSGSDYSISVGGDWDNDGTFEEQEGSVTFNGSADQDINDISGTATFYDLLISNTGGAVKPTSTLDVNDDLTIMAGTGSLDMSASSKNMTVAGDWANNNGASGFVQGSQTVTFDGGSNQALTNSAGTETFYNLNISNTGGAVQPTADLDIDGTMTIAASTGVLDMATNGADLTIAGSWINNNGASGFLYGTQAVTFNNSGTVSILSSATQTFYDLNVSNTGGVLRASSDLDVTNDLTILATTGVLDMSTSSKDLTVGGDWNNNNGDAGFLEGTQSVTFDGGANQTITSSATSETFYDLIIANSAGSVRPNDDLVISNDLSITGAGVLDMSINSKDMTITGDWTNDNGASGFVPGTQSVTFTNASNISIYNSASSENFYDLNISNTGGSVRTNSDLDIDGDLTILATTGSLNTLVNGNDVSVGGNWTNNNGTGGFLEGTNAVTFDGGADQSITNSSGTETFYDLTISNSAGAVKPVSIIDIDNDLTISGSGVLDVATNDIDFTVGGDWNNSNGASGFLPGDQLVTFDGSGAQSITNAAGEEFYDLTVNKSANDLTLSSAVTIGDNGTITLTSGNVVVSSNLIINGSASISGGGSSSYFESNGGVIRRNLDGNGATTFPIGDASNYSPCTFTLNSGTLTSAYIDVSVTNSGHPNRGSATDYLTRYWTIDQSGIGGSIDYDVSYTYLNGDIVGDESDLVQAKYSGGNWDSGGGIATGSNTVTRTGITSFSDFTAMDNSASALPVELLIFEATDFGDEVVLSWSTSSELNNDYFEVQRGQDDDFMTIGTVDGSGTTNKTQNYQYVDEQPLTGISYYRLVQVDFDGAVEISNAVAINRTQLVTKSAEMSVYPNPVRPGGTANVHIEGLNSQQEVLLVLRDVNGKTFYATTVFGAENGALDEVLTIESDLPTGIYFVIGSSQNQHFGRKLLVK